MKINKAPEINGNHTFKEKGNLLGTFKEVIISRLLLYPDKQTKRQDLKQTADLSSRIKTLKRILAEEN